LRRVPAPVPDPFDLPVAAWSSRRRVRVRWLVGASGSAWRESLGLPVQALSSAPALALDGRSAQPVSAPALRWAPGRPDPAEALREAAASEQRARVAQPEAGLVLASERRARAVQPEAATVVSAHAAAVPPPGAVTVASVPRAGEVAAEASAARARETAVSGHVEAQPPAAARSDAEERRAVVLRAAVGPQVWLRAEELRALAGAVRGEPLAAAVPAALSVALWMVASVFRQDPLRPAAGLARSRWVRLGVRLAHAMRSLQMASRSEPSWQAARSEVESCREIPGKVLEVSVAIN